ncbi:homeobox-like protein HDP1 [Procambarus clarkii]|uniref:homeobox-like protein HDP1 n=1 Tax=Procambarus clarkii TaxID=6728 RepID=UPI003743AC5A
MATPERTGRLLRGLQVHLSRLLVKWDNYGSSQCSLDSINSMHEATEVTSSSQEPRKTSEAEDETLSEAVRITPHVNELNIAHPVNSVNEFNITHSVNMPNELNIAPHVNELNIAHPGNSVNELNIARPVNMPNELNIGPHVNELNIAHHVNELNIARPVNELNIAHSC